MSQYATASEFNTFGIRAAALPPAVTDTDRLKAVSAASGRADSYLGARFRLPLSAWGDDLRQAVCAIAAFELVSSQVGFNPQAGHNMVLITRKEDAIRWLEQVASGKVTPAGITDTAPAAASVSRVLSRPPRGWR
jgi:phage gp36-like protein